MLSGHTKAFPARRDDRDVGARREQTLHEIGDRLEDVLAVVEEQHELGLVEDGDDAVDQPDTRSTFDPQRRGDRIESGAFVRRGQLAQHDRTNGACVAQAETDFVEQPGLADSAGTAQGHQAVGLRQRHHVVQQRVASHERRDRDVQPAGHGRRRRTGAGEKVGVLGDQCGRGLDAELVAQPPPEVVVHAQRFDVATHPCEGGHQQRPGPLPQRLLVGQCGELRDEVSGGTCGDADGGLCLLGADP